MKRMTALLAVVCMLCSATACTIPHIALPGSSVTTTTATPVTTQPTTTLPTTTTTTTTTAATTVATTTTAAPEEAYVEVYRALIEDYKVVLDARLTEGWNGGDVTQNASDVLKNAISEDLGYQWSCMVVELPMSTEGESPDDYGYLLHDIDDDDIPELFWVRNNHSIVAVFTYYNDQAVLLDAYWSRYRAYVSEEGELYSRGSSGAASTRFSIYAVRDGKLEDVSGFYSDLSSDGTSMVFYEYDEGEETAITKERFDQVVEIYPGEHSEFWLSKPILPLD